MNVRKRVSRLEILWGEHRPLHDMSDDELEARISNRAVGW